MRGRKSEKVVDVVSSRELSWITFAPLLTRGKHARKRQGSYHVILRVYRVRRLDLHSCDERNTNCSDTCN